MRDRTLLLMAPHRDDLIVIGRALRDAGYLVFPWRYHEGGLDAFVRVCPDLVLIDAAIYPSIESAECRDLVIQLGARVLLFARLDGEGDAATIQSVPEFPYPVAEYSGDARALAGLLSDPA